METIKKKGEREKKMQKNKKKINKKIILIIIAVLLILQIGWIAFSGMQWGWGPFAKLHDIKMSKLSGNDEKYALNQTEENVHDELQGKKIIFLGSSVTYGASAKGVSFADYIGKRNQAEVVKEAVSGTTLVDNGANSYISRLKKIKEAQADLFICQLSTNDASQKKELGMIGESKELDSFDTETVSGAIEYIICYAKETWDCPVMFYTNPRYDSAEYEEMVQLLLQIQKKWGIGVIDLWNDAEFNELTDEECSLYMADKIHPTQAGYLEWWTPYMEEKMEEYLADQKSK